MCVCFYLDLDVNNNIENLVKHVIVYIYICIQMLVNPTPIHPT